MIIIIVNGISLRKTWIIEFFYHELFFVINLGQIKLFKT